MEGHITACQWMKGTVTLAAAPSALTRHQLQLTPTASVHQASSGLAGNLYVSIFTGRNEKNEDVTPMKKINLFACFYYM
jgi:hypothetical protein